MENNPAPQQPVAPCGWYDMVRKFHKAFGHPAPDEITEITRERQRDRALWMAEEIIEYTYADNMIDQVDSMLDLIVFALGTLVEMGINPRELFDTVHEANMGKLYPDGNPRYRDDGKLLKPANWEPPQYELERILKRRARVEEQNDDKPDDGGIDRMWNEDGEIPW